MGIKKAICPLPNARAQTFTRRSLAGKPSKPTSLKEGVMPVVNKKAFWEKLPWDEVNFFSREIWIDTPAVVGEHTVDRFLVNSGMVLVITGAVFRAAIILNEGPGHVFYVLAGDDYLGGAGAMVMPWFVSVGGRQAMDRTYLRVGAGAPIVSGWNLLNQNIAPLAQDFAVFASEESAVECRVFLTADMIADYPEVHHIGVEWSGVWIPITAYTKMKEELR